MEIGLSVTSAPNTDAWLTELRPAMLAVLPVLGEVLREPTDGCFDAQADPWGNAWQETRRSAAGEGRILIDRGFLRGSIHVEIDETTLTVRVAVGGAAAAYAAVHQWGSETKHIVARPYLALRGNADAPTVDLPPAVLAEVTATIQDALNLYAQRMNQAR